MHWTADSVILQLDEPVDEERDRVHSAAHSLRIPASLSRQPAVLIAESRITTWPGISTCLQHRSIGRAVTRWGLGQSTIRSTEARNLLERLRETMAAAA